MVTDTETSKQAAKPRYRPEFTTVPPPSDEVTHVITAITVMFNRLEEDTEEQLKVTSPGRRKESLKRLLEEIRDARYQTNRCEYHLAKEYLERVIPEAKESSMEGILPGIFALLDWCRENDRRGSYSWVPIRYDEKKTMRFLLELASIPCGSNQGVMHAIKSVIVCKGLTPEEANEIVREVLTSKTTGEIDWLDLAAGVYMTANGPAFGDTGATEEQKNLLRDFAKLLECNASEKSDQ